MRRCVRQRCLAVVLSASLLAGGYTPAVTAGWIGAQDLITSDARPDPALYLSVAERLVDLGVAPELVRSRVSALTYAELSQLDQRLDELPAGAGGLALIGAVFVVLPILELVGVINIFNKL